MKNSEILTGEVLYGGDYCMWCDNPITEEDLQSNGIVLSTHRGQFGHLVHKPMHKKCFVADYVAVDIGLGGAEHTSDYLEYLKHFIGLALENK